LLAKLRDQLAMHFSLEEAYGYFEDALDTAPHLARRAEELRAQHGSLYRALSLLAERAEQLSDGRQSMEARFTVVSMIVADVAAGYREFSAKFAEHESQESQLICEAFNSDIGSGD
jgi:chromosome segregation ATPase